MNNKIDSQIYSVDSIAHLFGLTFNRLDSLIRKGKVPAPHSVMGVRARFYTASDLPRLRHALEPFVAKEEAIHV